MTTPLDRLHSLDYARRDLPGREPQPLVPLGGQRQEQQIQRVVVSVNPISQDRERRRRIIGHIASIPERATRHPHMPLRVRVRADEC
jgi:hypothetical protein